MEELDSKFSKLYLNTEKGMVEAPSETQYLVVTGIEFGEQVTLHWINLKTNEVGYTTMSYEVYRNNQKPL